MRTVLLAVLCLLQLACFGQPYYFRHYQVENGLSNNTVGCVLQDDKGFLWFGSKDGLNRFDGYTFKVFQHERESPKSIGSNFVISLYQDKKRQLWVGTDRGLYRYHNEEEDFSIEAPVPVDEIRGILADDRERLWIVVRNKLGWLDLKKGQFQSFEPLKGYGIISISAGANGTIWAASAEGKIHRINTASMFLESYDVFGSGAAPKAGWIQKVYDTGTGIVLVGTVNHGLYLFNTATHAFRKKELTNSNEVRVFIRDFARYTDKEYWIASEAGLFVYNIATDSVTHIQKSYYNPYSLSDNALYSLCMDTEGGMWIGTYFGGVNYYPKQLTSFRKYFPQSAEDATTGNAIHEICKDPYGDLWIGTEDAGLIRLNPRTNQRTVFTPSSVHHKISHTNVHGLLVTGDEMWVGTFHGGLDVIDLKTNRVVRHYSAAKNGLSSDFVSDLVKTKKGRILAATDRGVCVYNPATDHFSPMKGFPSTFYKTIFEDSKETVWAGSYSEGLYYCNPFTSSSGGYQFEPGKPTSIISNRVNWIFEDRRGQIWVCTEGGLSLLNRLQGSFCNYTTHDGFPGNLMYAALEDDKGDFWVSTYRGLANFSPVTQQVNQVYTRANGLLSNQFNYNSAFNDGQGQLYFGSVKGLISFTPDKFMRNLYTPPLYLTGFQIDNKEVPVAASGSPLLRSIIHTKEVTLTHDQSSFSIDFAALSYTSSESTEYAYIMKGLEQDWTYLKSNRKVFFTKLAQGTYIFSLRSAVSKDVWSKDYDMLLIKVLPPFWKSRPAYFLYTFLFAVAVYFAVRSYHRYHQAKNHRQLEIIEYEKQKEISQAKIDFFINVAHEIKTPLTLIRGPLEKIMDEADDPASVKTNLKIMEKNTDRLIELTNQLLDFRKAEAGINSLSLEETDMVALLNDHYLRFQAAAAQKELEFELEHPRSFTAFVDIDAMNKIVSNLLNNAIKYAVSKVYVELIEVNEDDTEFRIVFKNDGPLIPAEMAEKIFETFFRLKETRRMVGTGLGLTLSRSLAQLHGGNLFLEAPEGDLNVFVLTLPVKALPLNESAVN